MPPPAWRDASVAKGFLQNEPHEGQPATFDTEVRVLYDDRALYFGVFARDGDASALIVSDFAEGLRRLGRRRLLQRCERSTPGERLSTRGVTRHLTRNFDVFGIALTFPESLGDAG